MRTSGGRSPAKILLGTAAAVLLLVRVHPGSAQSPTASGWAQFANVSRSSTMSSCPSIVADRAGVVHVFWAEDIDGPRMGEPDAVPTLGGNAMMYARWDGSSWSVPVDIWYSQAGIRASWSSAAVDRSGTIHLTWTGGGSIYYSHAPAERASIAVGWSPAIELARNVPPSAYESAVVVDRNDVVHVAYPQGGDTSGVYHVALTNGSLLWSRPTRISQFSTEGRGLVAGGLSLAVDNQNRLHATWNLFDKDGAGQAVYYAQSTDAGESWSEPRLVDSKQPEDFGVAWCNVGIIAEEVNLVWESGERAWRFHSWSSDGGRTWTEPERIFANLVGSTGAPQMATDSAGTLHLVTEMRGELTDGSDYDYHASGIRYSYWTGTGWNAPFLVPGPSPESRRYGGLFIRMAIVRGNELVTVWEDEGKGEIMSTSARSPAPEVVPRPYPALPSPTPSPSAVPTPTVMVTATSAANRRVSTSAAGTVVTTPTWMPVALGFVPSALLLVAVAIVRACRPPRSGK